MYEQRNKGPKEGKNWGSENASCSTERDFGIPTAVRIELAALTASRKELGTPTGFEYCWVL
jgi:hypothetical protein